MTNASDSGPYAEVVAVGIGWHSVWVPDGPIARPQKNGWYQRFGPVRHGPVRHSPIFY